MEDDLKSVFIARLITSGVAIEDAPKLATALCGDIEEVVESENVVTMSDHFEWCPLCDSEIH